MTYGWAKEGLSRNSLRAGTLAGFLAAADANCFLAPYMVRFLAASRLRKQRFTTERALQRAYRTIVADLNRDQQGKGTRVVVCCGDAGIKQWQGPFAGHAATKMSPKRLAEASKSTPGVHDQEVSRGCVVSLVAGAVGCVGPSLISSFGPGLELGLRLPLRLFLAPDLYPPIPTTNTTTHPPDGGQARVHVP